MPGRSLGVISFVNPHLRVYCSYLAVASVLADRSTLWNPTVPGVFATLKIENRQSTPVYPHAERLHVICKWEAVVPTPYQSL